MMMMMCETGKGDRSLCITRQEAFAKNFLRIFPVKAHESAFTEKSMIATQDKVREASANRCDVPNSRGLTRLLPGRFGVKRTVTLLMT